MTTFSLVNFQTNKAQLRNLEKGKESKSSVGKFPWGGYSVWGEKPYIKQYLLSWYKYKYNMTNIEKNTTLAPW